MPSLPIENCIERPLFGGAILSCFPLRFQDVSNIREVPDHQEVFADPNRDVSLMFELLDFKHDVADNGSALWFLRDLAREQDAEETLVVDRVNMGDIGLRYGDAPIIVTTAVGKMVNMSIAILPMSAEYTWNPTTVGFIQSSFFWGYLLTQIAGGIWADTVGGKRVLGFGIVWWSVATILTPVAAKLGLPFLLLVRAIMGVGECVAMPAMNNILSKWISVSERSRALTLVYSGMYLGSVTGLAFSSFFIHNLGWPSVFYSFGSLGTVWFAIWLNKAYSSPLEDPGLSPREKKLITSNSVTKEHVAVIPWRLIL